jgi:RHS repeat-associated protein
MTFADLYYNRYRDYDPSTGNYIQADPIGLAGGANPYSYAMGNPVRYMDPLGLFTWPNDLTPKSPFPYKH